MGNQCYQIYPDQTHFQTKNANQINNSDQIIFNKEQQQQQIKQITIKEFIQDNKTFFKNAKTKHIYEFFISNQVNLLSLINKFNIKYATQHQIMYLSEITNNLQFYQGDAMILDSSKKQFYVGHIISGKMQGQGLLIDAKGNQYKGNFEKNHVSGQGQYSLLYPQRKYKGFWKNGFLQGKGQIFYQDGAKYQGNLQQSKKQGHGILTFRDGSVYQGYFKADLMHGCGVLIKETGVQINGQWRQGKYQNQSPESTSFTGSANEVSSS